MMGSPIAVVVDASFSELLRTERALRRACPVVRGVGTFALAKVLLGSILPDVVVADVRLQAYNGLHLAAICSVRLPGTPFIVTHSVHDAGLEAEAKRLGATWVVKTPGREELMRTVYSLLGSSRETLGGVRRSYRKQVPVATAVTVTAFHADVLDVSYGGLRLNLKPSAQRAEDQPPVAFDVTIPLLELSLRASRVWAKPDACIGGWTCGVDVSQTSPRELHRWWDFVDSVN
jgi:hypothetical protein